MRPQIECWCEGVARACGTSDAGAGMRKSLRWTALLRGTVHLQRSCQGLFGRACRRPRPASTFMSNLGRCPDVVVIYSGLDPVRSRSPAELRFSAGTRLPAFTTMLAAIPGVSTIVRVSLAARKPAAPFGYLLHKWVRRA